MKTKTGRKEESEEKASNMTVYAISSTSGEIIASTLTDSNGTYTFTLDKGNYIVAFLYDNSVYTTTTYQASGINSAYNSDATTKMLTIDGTSQKVGATDELSLTTNLSNIDIGLALKENFDLNIEKYISKVTVVNNKGTKVYEQDDSTTLAKVEIGSKYLSSSVVTVEYTIRITNVGNTSGYAKTIVDYMPSSVNFDTTLNEDWYLSGDNLYNISLENNIIEPGESKDITLILTKTMTEENTGLVNNKVEITESSSSTGYEDESENIGSADVIISISTGKIVYTLIVILAITILGILVFVIRKNLKEKIVR